MIGAASGVRRSSACCSPGGAGRCPLSMCQASERPVPSCSATSVVLRPASDRATMTSLAPRRPSCARPPLLPLPLAFAVWRGASSSSCSGASSIGTATR
jgi:hypothetical protein